MSSATKPAKLTELSSSQIDPSKSDQLKQKIDQHRPLETPQSEVALTMSQEDTPPSKASKTESQVETLTLQTPKGKVTLTESQVEEWFANTEKALRAETSQEKTGPVTQESNDRELGAKFLSRFGLKSAKDVIQFLNSPAGGTVKETIAAQWSEREAIKAEQAFELREKEGLRKRQLAYFLAGAMMHKAAKAKELNRAYAEAGKKSIERSKENATGGTSHGTSEAAASAHAAYVASLSQQLAAYENTIKALEGQLTVKTAARAAITAQIAAIQQHYATLNSHVAQAHAHYAQAMAPNLSQAAVINAIQFKRGHLQTQLAQKKLEENLLRSRGKHHLVLLVAQESIDIEREIDALWEQRELHLATKNLELSLQDRIVFIESNVAKLTNKLEKQLTEIERLFSTGKVEDELKAMAMKSELQGLFSEIATLEDMVDVLKGKKFLFDANGNQTDSYTNAVCILSPQQRLVKDNGKYYVIGPMQSLASMSDYDKHRAHEKFRETNTLDKLLHHNEKAEVKGKQSELQKIDAEIHELSEQIQFVQQKKEEVSTLLVVAIKQGPQHHAPLPGIFNQTPKPVPSETWLQIERLMDKLKNGPTKEDVKKLHDLIPKDNRTLLDKLKKALNAESPVEMQRYLQTIELSGVLAYKPSVIAITSPQVQKTSEFQESPESPSSMFSIDPLKKHLKPY